MHSDQHCDGDLNVNTYKNTNADAFGNSYIDTNRHGNTITDGDQYTNAHGYPDKYGYPHTHAYALHRCCRQWRFRNRRCLGH